MILFSRFYDNQEETVIADTMRNAILRYGRFDACYFDRGKQYVAKQLKLSLAKLSIRIRHAPVDSGKSKGKILSAVFYYPHILKKYSDCVALPMKMYG